MFKKVSLKSLLTVATLSLGLSATANAAGMIKLKGVNITEQQGIMACALGSMGGGGEMNTCIPRDQNDKPLPDNGLVDPIGTDQTCYEEDDSTQGLLAQQCNAYLESKM